MASPGKPWITANQVTLARLIPMPLLSWLIYRGAGQGMEGNPYMASALIAGTLIGCTDWVDGMLARKYGSTVLGGLLDPIADKVFIAFAYTPFADDAFGLGLVPAWALALMFTREFFVTALRSAYEQRDLTMKTSYLGKVKTWTQMQGIGVMLLFPLVGEGGRAFLTWFLGSLVVAPIAIALGLWVVKKKFWRGAIVMSASVAPVLALHLHGDMELTIRWIMFAVVAITWVSGIDYIAVGWKKLRGRGDFTRADGVRLIGSIALPVLLFAVLVETPAPAWPVFTILAVELAVGGLDNLLSHHKVATKALAWGSRVLGTSALLGAALLFPRQSELLTIVAAAVSTVGVAAEFWRGRDYFMDKRIRDRAGRTAATSPPADPPAAKSGVPSPDGG
ncbi:MAG: CDP-alcohol phosphatidyltransferase family protein [Deltaproteobacteria bacterium]|nr:CDP-alcohol phosphatidyltransferase family protein [Deltaproteobacteria bacterium]MCW5806245.1 CDP-alcohol phosphatidyltransferase family protein [Deltaproteobacteria bacterium]